MYELAHFGLSPLGQGRDEFAEDYANARGRAKGSC